MAFALGEMGMTAHEYYSITRREFLLKWKGFNNAETRNWQHTRRITWQIYASQPFAKKKPESIYKFMPLPNDPKSNFRDLDLEYIKRTWDSFKNKT